MIVASEHWPRAIFGGPLWGDMPLRFVFIDEAGTSEGEPATIVVGLIVDADNQLLTAEAAAAEVLGSVPAKFRDGFVFHAKEVWGSEKYRTDWSMADRLGILKRMMALPRRLNIPLSVSLVQRTMPKPDDLPEQISLAQYHHFVAFAECIVRADKYIRDYAEMREVGTVVAEDVPEMRKFLKAAVKMYRDKNMILPPGMVHPTLQEQRLGYVTQECDWRVTRVRNAIHFVEKGDEPVTELADACAFGLRRYFAGQDFGADFAQAIFGGNLPPREDWLKGPWSASTYRWKTD